jgi:hypothetical protein
MSKRAILELILSQLETITTANGYLTNIGSNATYARDTNQEWDTEGVTFRDFGCNISENNIYHVYDLDLEIEAIAFGDDLITIGCDLEEDLISLIARNLNWAGDALKTEFHPDSSIVKDFQTAGKSAVSVTLNLSVQFRLPKWSVG